MMSEYYREHLMAMYGIHPTIHVPMSPVLPTGLVGPEHALHPRFRGMPRHAGLPGANLDEFVRANRERANSLLGTGKPGPQPWHPLYSGRASIASLEAEGARLQKENLELREELESLKREGLRGSRKTR